MKIRVISGIALVVIFVPVMLLGGYVLAAMLCLLSLIATLELSRAFGYRQEGKRSAMEIIGYLAVLVHYLLLVISRANPRFFIGTIIGFIFAETLIYVVRFPRYSVSQLTEVIFTFLYAPVMLSFFYLIRRLYGGEWFVWLPFLAWACDTCAYLAGRAFGKHKLCPALSPKKTVEGAIGGLLGSALIAGAYGLILPHYTAYNERVVWACLLIGLLCGVLSQLGDLLASGIKRDKGIKDYGSLIPGHGGVMDRFDSVIFMLPVVYFMIVFFLQGKPIV
ncbi:MAG: phosphatidate cytidylyltransferase [Lachnospiraceae bacterium]|nr:phosphatidate cytidylyltransferase [Lachnospiraceae bacterium]